MGVFLALLALAWVVCGFIAASIYFIMCLKRGRLAGEDIKMMIVMFTMGIASILILFAVFIDGLKGKTLWERKAKP